MISFVNLSILWFIAFIYFILILLLKKKTPQTQITTLLTYYFYTIFFFFLFAGLHNLNFQVFIYLRSMALLLGAAILLLFIVRTVYPSYGLATYITLITFILFIARLGFTGNSAVFFQQTVHLYVFLFSGIPIVCYFIYLGVT